MEPIRLQLQATAHRPLDVERGLWVEHLALSLFVARLRVLDFFDTD